MFVDDLTVAVLNAGLPVWTPDRSPEPPYVRVGYDGWDTVERVEQWPVTLIWAQTGCGLSVEQLGEMADAVTGLYGRMLLVGGVTDVMSFDDRKIGKTDFTGVEFTVTNLGAAVRLIK